MSILFLLKYPLCIRGRLRLAQTKTDPRSGNKFGSLTGGLFFLNLCAGHFLTAVREPLLPASAFERSPF